MRTKWKTAPISRWCEQDGCSGKVATHAYPAIFRGWMALCWDHAQKHKPYIESIRELIEKGETLKP